MSSTARYVSLAVRGLVLVAVFAALWPWVADWYNALVAKALNVLAPGGVTVRASLGHIFIAFAPDAPGTEMGIHGFVLAFGLVFMGALVAASPGLGLWRRGAWLGAAFGMTLGSHVLGTTLWVWGLSVAFDQRVAWLTVGRAMTAFAIFWGLLPALPAALWCYKFWRPAQRRADPPAMPSSQVGRLVL